MESFHTLQSSCSSWNPPKLLPKPLFPFLCMAYTHCWVTLFQMYQFLSLCLTKFVIKLEELYGLSCCKFNVHCLTHLAHCVKDCGPLWATSAFTFESHNHVLMNMCSGTQCVPQQITETFLLSSKVSSLSKSCMDENSSPQVTEAVSRLTDHARFKHCGVSDGLKFISGGLAVTLDALMLLPSENLLDLTVDNRCGKMYDKFVFNHKFYSSIRYT